MITTLRIKKIYEDRLQLAIRWYAILSILNGFKWSPLEISIMAYTAVEGNISAGGRKERFCELFSSTKNSVSNSLSKMQKKHFLVKHEGKIVVHPQLKLDFNNNILLQLNMSFNETT